MAGNELDLMSLGVKAGAAQGFANAAISFKDSMELRRKERIQRKMHVEQMTLGMARLTEQNRQARARIKQAEKELSALNMRDVRGHKQRAILKEIQMGFDAGQQDQLIAANINLQNDRITAEAEQNRIQRGFEGGQNDNLNDTNILRARIMAHKGSRVERAQARAMQEQTDAARAARYDKLMTRWVNQDLVRDPDTGERDLERVDKLARDLAKETGIDIKTATDQIIQQSRDDMVTAFAGTEGFEDIGDIASKALFGMAAASAILDDKDLRANTARAVRTKHRNQQMIADDQNALALETEITMNGGGAMPLVMEDGKLVFDKLALADAKANSNNKGTIGVTNLAAVSLLKLNSDVDGILKRMKSGGIPSHSLKSAIATIAAENGLRASDIAPHIELMNMMEGGDYKGVSGITERAMRSTMTRLNSVSDGSNSAEEAPGEHEVFRNNNARLRDGLTAVGELNRRHLHQRKLNTIEPLRHTLSEVTAQLDKAEKAGETVLAASFRKMEKMIHKDLAFMMTGITDKDFQGPPADPFDTQDPLPADPVGIPPAEVTADPPAGIPPAEITADRDE